jgi:alkylhydroperoxidase family enzyme
LRALFAPSAIEPATVALCAAMVAGLTFCTPLLVECRREARKHGVDAGKLNELWGFARSERYGPAERAALSAAVALTREPRALPEAVAKELRESYDDGQVAEIVCAIAETNALARIVNALQLPLRP